MANQKKQYKATEQHQNRKSLGLANDIILSPLHTLNLLP